MGLLNQPSQQTLRLLKEVPSNPAGFMPAEPPVCQSAPQISDLPASTSLEPSPSDKSGVGEAHPIGSVSLQNSGTFIAHASSEMGGGAGEGNERVEK